MRATLIDIKHLLGIEEARLAPGQVTIISGSNGSGKSSILAAFQAALGGGNLLNLKRVGSDDEPEIVLELDGGRLRIERKGDKTKLLERVGDTAAYEELKRPQERLDQLFDPRLTSPMRLLQATPGEFRDILLEVLPLDLDRGALLSAIGDVWPAGKALPDAHPLEVLSFARTTLFDERTGVNRSQKDKAKAAHELSMNIPAEFPEDPADELRKAAQARDAVFQRLADKRAAAENAEAQALAAARAEYEQVQTHVEGEFKAGAAKIRKDLAERLAELEGRIAILKAEAETAVQAIRTKGQEELDVADRALEGAEATATAARKTALNEVEAMRPDLQAAERKVAELAALSKNVAQLQESKRLADKFEKESDDLKAVSERLTKALEAVEGVKAQLLASLPIEGLEFRGKEIFIGGVPFEHVNTAAKIRLAVKVAVLRANTRTLPLIWVDGAEALDPVQFKLLEDELCASGVQAVIAKVGPEPLSIETREGAPQKVTKMPPASGTSKRRQTALTE